MEIINDNTIRDIITQRIRLIHRGATRNEALKIEMLLQIMKDSERRQFPLLSLTESTGGTGAGAGDTGKESYVAVAQLVQNEQNWQLSALTQFLLHCGIRQWWLYPNFQAPLILPPKGWVGSISLTDPFIHTPFLMDLFRIVSIYELHWGKSHILKSDIDQFVRVLRWCLPLESYSSYDFNNNHHNGQILNGGWMEELGLAGSFVGIYHSNNVEPTSLLQGGTARHFLVIASGLPRTSLELCQIRLEEKTDGLTKATFKEMTGPGSELDQARTVAIENCDRLAARICRLLKLSPIEKPTERLIEAYESSGFCAARAREILKEQQQRGLTDEQIQQWLFEELDEVFTRWWPEGCPFDITSRLAYYSCIPDDLPCKESPVSTLPARFRDYPFGELYLTHLAPHLRLQLQTKFNLTTVKHPTALTATFRMETNTFQYQNDRILIYSDCAPITPRTTHMVQIMPNLSLNLIGGTWSSHSTQTIGSGFPVWFPFLASEKPVEAQSNLRDIYVSYFHGSSESSTLLPKALWGSFQGFIGWDKNEDIAPLILGHEHKDFITLQPDFVYLSPAGWENGLSIFSKDPYRKPIIKAEWV